MLAVSILYWWLRLGCLCDNTVGPHPPLSNGVEAGGPPTVVPMQSGKYSGKYSCLTSAHQLLRVCSCGLTACLVTETLHSLHVGECTAAQAGCLEETFGVLCRLCSAESMDISTCDVYFKYGVTLLHSSTVTNTPRHDRMTRTCPLNCPTLRSTTLPLGNFSGAAHTASFCQYSLIQIHPTCTLIAASKGTAGTKPYMHVAPDSGRFIQHFHNPANGMGRTVGQAESAAAR